MVGTTTNISICMDTDLKTQAEVYPSDSAKRIPIVISLNQPNSETCSALMEAVRIEKDSNAKHYTDLDELLNDLKA